MRKRAQARKQVNHDDMWITLPTKAPPVAAEAAETAVRTEQPTYEDNWYRVLRTRDEPPQGASLAPTEANVDEVNEGSTDEPASAPSEVPARPDLVPQVASSLD